jgi:homoserine kinase
VESAERTSVLGCEKKYAGPGNLFLRSMRYAAEILGGPAPEVRLSIDARIPLARGLGSSAAMTAGGVAAALLLDGGRREGTPLDEVEKRFIFEVSAAMEGHPDNAAPAVFGGFCGSIVENPSKGGEPHCLDSLPFRSRCARCEVDPNWGFHALIPPFELSTKEARAALPASLSRQDAVFNLGRAALVALAFEKRDAALLGAACEDRVHQPYRKALISGYDEVTEACRGAGAAAVWLSGSGPTILALTVGVEAGQRLAGLLAPALAARPEGPWRHEILSADPEGLDYTCG